MSESLIEVWRGPFLESLHRGHAVVMDRVGIVESWGDPDKIIYPRSSAKPLQALPILESGAGRGLSDRQVAATCASHEGAAIHVDLVKKWLVELGFGEQDLICGPEWPKGGAERSILHQSGRKPDRCFNNCSGKHSGFLALVRHLKAGPEYVATDHPVQIAVKAAIEEMAGETSPGFGIDGCSAPNFAVSLKGLASAMARMADPSAETPSRKAAIQRITSAMHEHPEIVAGQGRACTELMRACPEAVVKTGAEGVFVGILPIKGLGFALKIEDGATRAAEAAAAAILVRLGVADTRHPDVRKRLCPKVKNWAGTETGQIRPAETFLRADVWTEIG
jgi:L-asparaginase II